MACAHFSQHFNSKSPQKTKTVTTQGSVPFFESHGAELQTGYTMGEFFLTNTIVYMPLTCTGDGIKNGTL